MKKRFTLLALPLLAALSAQGQCTNASFTSTAPACSNTNVSFTNTSGNSGGGWTYFWDFDFPNQGGTSPNSSTNQYPSGISYSPIFPVNLIIPFCLAMIHVVIH